MVQPNKKSQRAETKRRPSGSAEPKPDERETQLSSMLKPALYKLPKQREIWQKNNLLAQKKESSESAKDAKADEKPGSIVTKGEITVNSSLFEEKQKKEDVVKRKKKKKTEIQLNNQLGPREPREQESDKKLMYLNVQQSQIDIIRETSVQQQKDILAQIDTYSNQINLLSSREREEVSLKELQGEIIPPTLNDLGRVEDLDKHMNKL